MSFSNFEFFNVDTSYLKALNKADCRSPYSENKDYSSKPFLGISGIGNINYFIPLTSAKEHHLDLEDSGSGYFTIYEYIDSALKRDNDIVKPYTGGRLKKILSVLYVNNMIPVPEGFYSQVAYFNSVLMKEYEFCCSIRGGIIEMAKNVYYETGNSIKRYADFKVRENVYKQYTK